MNIRGYSACVAAGAPMLFLTAPARAQAFYTGQIIAVGFNFCPAQTMEANGQLLSIRDYTPLFSLFATTYGGDGLSNFALPDLRGRRAIGQGPGPGLQPYIQGQVGGRETATLTSRSVIASS